MGKRRRSITFEIVYEMSSKKMKQFFNILVFTCLIYFASAAITEEQMRNSAAMVRNVCQPKSKLSDDVVDKMRDKVFPNDKAAKCFVQCILENMGMMRKSKVNYDAAMKQFDLLLPDSMKDDYKNALTKCKDSANGEKNACEAAHKLIVCFAAANQSFTFV